MSQSNRSLNQIDGQVAEDLVGEVWPSAEPGENPVLYGHAVLEPRNCCSEVGILVIFFI